MPWNIDYTQDDGVVTVTTSGPMDVGAIEQMVVDMLGVGQGFGSTRYLLDHRDMTPAMSAVHIYDLPGIVNKAGVTHNIRLAMVYDPGSARKADFEFYETRAYNLGFEHRLFTDMPTALGWLSGAGGKK